MPRATPRRGIERATWAELKGELTVSELADSEHVRNCPDCQGAKTRTTDRCNTGWETAKRLTRAQNAVRRWKERPAADQPALFDTEGSPPDET